VGYDRLQDSIALCSFSFKMNSDANIAAHLSIGPNANGKQNITGFVEFFLAVGLSGGSRMTC